jgi:hypothetical protein
MGLTKKILMAVVTLAMVVSFQNCGKTFGNSSDEMVMSSSLFVDMSSDEADETFQAYSKSCVLPADFKFQSINPGSMVTLNGNQYAASINSDIPSIAGNGNLLIKGLKSSLIVKKVSSFGGNIALCGVSLDLATGTGKSVTTIYVEGGGVNAIADFSGNIIVNGDRFPESIKNFKGNIIVGTAGGQVLGRKYVR